mmetsp:Transcript_83084/g.147075  ORF Transcript_83084/g.147075 Transcript_83084/m.147075 type:complete len:139 (+) Transcript_83084:844-1260(+)
MKEDLKRAKHQVLTEEGQLPMWVVRQDTARGQDRQTLDVEIHTYGLLGQGLLHRVAPEHLHMARASSGNAPAVKAQDRLIRGRQEETEGLQVIILIILEVPLLLVILPAEEDLLDQQTLGAQATNQLTSQEGPPKSQR